MIKDYQLFKRIPWADLSWVITRTANPFILTMTRGDQSTRHRKLQSRALFLI